MLVKLHFNVFEQGNYLNLAAMANVGLDENTQEMANGLFVRTLTNNANTPGLKRL
jgi:hypothetical protein